MVKKFRKLMMFSMASMLALGLVTVFPVGAISGTIQRISVTESGEQANNGSEYSPSISADGRFVAFTSASTNLVAGTDFGDCASKGVFVKDLTSGVVKFAGPSIDNDDVEISGNGQFVTFAAPEGCSSIQVKVYDRITEETSIASLSNEGDVANGAVYDPSISFDGRYVAFESGASNLAAGSNIVVHDRVTQTVSTATVPYDGDIPNGATRLAAISGDGNVVAFASTASNLVDGDTNGTYDIFSYNRTTGETKRVSDSNLGDEPNGSSEHFGPGGISFDGRQITFGSEASNLVEGDVNGLADVFVYDTQTTNTRKINAVVNGDERFNAFYAPPAISRDGQHLLASCANLEGGFIEIYTYDLVTNQTEIVTPGASVMPSGHSYYTGNITDDGNKVVFTSDASNLVANDTNDTTDVFVFSHSTDTTAPTIGQPSFTRNPMFSNQTSTVRASASDTGSGIAGGEYYIGTDPGVGNGVAMTVDGGNIRGTIPSGQSIGVRTVGVRAKDNAGNWSNTRTRTLIVLPGLLF